MITKSNGRTEFKTDTSEFQQVHFPKTDLTDRTFGIISPKIYSDAANVQPPPVQSVATGPQDAARNNESREHAAFKDSRCADVVSDWAVRYQM